MERRDETGCDDDARPDEYPAHAWRLRLRIGIALGAQLLEFDRCRAIKRLLAGLFLPYLVFVQVVREDWRA